MIRTQRVRITSDASGKGVLVSVQARIEGVCVGMPRWLDIKGGKGELRRAFQVAPMFAEAGLVAVFKQPGKAVHAGCCLVYGDESHAREEGPRAYILDRYLGHATEQAEREPGLRSVSPSDERDDKKPDLHGEVCGSLPRRVGPGDGSH
jgi:hypothetical protein